LKISIVPANQASGFVRTIHESANMSSPILLGGTRWDCVEEAVLAMINGKTVGIATIAPQGEENSGQPTIVAIYVLPEHRHNQLGYKLLEAAVDQMIAKNLVPIRLDVLNSKVMKMINRLPEEKRNQLKIHNCSGGNFLDKILDL